MGSISTYVSDEKELLLREYAVVLAREGKIKKPNIYNVSRFGLEAIADSYARMKQQILEKQKQSEGGGLDG